MSRRAHVWFLIAIIFLAIGTTIALTRQQANFNEHQKIAQEACQLSLANRRVIRELVEIELQEADHPQGLKKVQDVEAEINKLIEATNCKEES